MNTLEAVLQKHPKKYLIFDFDETLFTLHLNWERYFSEMSNRLYALDPTYSQERSSTKLENGITQKLGRVAAEVRWEYSRQFEKDNLRGVSELHDLTDFIRTNHTKYQFYLWTSNMRETVEPILQKSGLLPYFTTLITKGDVLLMKPDPEGFQLVFNPLTHKKSEWLMIGNSKNDKKAAEAAKIDFWLRP